MHEKMILLTLISVFWLSTIVVTPIIAQERTAGVNEGDSFLYSYDVSYESDDPNAEPPWFIANFMQLEFENVTVLSVSGARIECMVTVHFKNGTSFSEQLSCNIETGENFGLLFIPANLSHGDIIYPSYEEMAMSINETISRTYLDSVRETNHVNVTTTFQTGKDLINVYWDKMTGVPIEHSSLHTNKTDGYTTVWSYSIEIVETNLWAVPEFPSFLILPLFMIATLLAVTVYRIRKHSMQH